MQNAFPVGGTPIIPPSYLTAYFVFFFVCLAAIYIYVYKKKKPILLWQKVKLLLALAFILKATAVVGIGGLAVYWLVPTPGIRRTIPKLNETSFSPTDRIEVVFDRPVNRGLLEKSISPETPGVWVFEDSIYTTHLYRKLVFYPTYSLHPDTTYTINIDNINNLVKISKPYDYHFEFKTQTSPKVVSVSPVSGQREVDPNSQIKITLDSPNGNVAEFEFLFTPSVDFEAKLDSSKTVYTLTPKSAFLEGTEYNLKILKSDVILNLEDTSVIQRNTSTQEYDGNFTIKLSENGILSNLTASLTPKTTTAKVSKITPENGWTAVSVKSPIKIIFDKETNHSLAESKFTLSPKVDGVFSWEGNTMVFTPKADLALASTYTVTFGTDTKVVFSTQNPATKLAVPAYLQKYTLSCEIASLRMALNFRGANVSEDDLIPKVGLDSTPHNGDTWGNPYNAFVGNIRGTQMKDGYGVYWGPIAKAARSYRQAQDFQGWNTNQVTKEITNGNPVIIWIYSHNGTRTSWKTPDGVNVYAVRDEHAVVVVGFVGPADNPTQIIVNDPLIGQVYWSRSTFDKKWAIFGNSGVVVY